MLSFRVEDSDAIEAQQWAEQMGIGRSELLREALRRYITTLRSQVERELYAAHPVTRQESALAEIADWGPAEDWSDWSHAER